MPNKFSTPRGTADILPEDWPYYDFVQTHAIEVAQLFGYQRIETPILGQTDLFSRATGEATDIIEKEMYSFRDRGGDDLALRPEGTAPVMRAYLEHRMSRLPQPVKLFYIERMYRYDRPQKGRFREHRQFGCEAIGSDDPYVDVEMVALLDTFYKRIGVTNLSLRVNSIGNKSCRPEYLRVLVEYLREREVELAPTDRERISRNPLRVLDTKEERSQAVVEAAQHMIDYLCDDCRAHWERFLHGLDLLGLDYVTDHRLVRGLDYYTRTVFEFVPPRGGAQGTVGAGGRYDDLSESMDGPHVPGIGFGSGLERLVLNVRELKVPVPPAPHPTVFFANVGETQDQTLVEAMRARNANVSADMALDHRSLKSQLRRADSEHADYAAIIGEDELSRGTVTLRRLDTGEQEELPTTHLTDALSG